MNKKEVSNNVEDTSIKLSQSDIALDLNGTFLLNIVDPEEINYYWTSGNTNVICVLGSGKSCNLMGVGAGESFVKVTDDIGNEGFCNVIVSDFSEIEIVTYSSSDINNYVEEVEEIRLPYEEITLTLPDSGKQAEQVKIGVSIAPSTAIKTNQIYFISTDPTIVDVYEGGIMIPKSVGFASIQVMCGNKTKSFDVTVKDNKTAKIQEIANLPYFIEIRGRGKEEYTYTIMPLELSYMNLDISMEDTSIASAAVFPMLNKIVVTSKYPGSTNLIVKWGDGISEQKKIGVTIKELIPQSMTMSIQKEETYYNSPRTGGKDYIYSLTFRLTLYPTTSSAYYLYNFYYAPGDTNNKWASIDGRGNYNSANIVGEDGKTSDIKITMTFEGSNYKPSKSFGISVTIRSGPEYKIPSNTSELNNRIDYYGADIERARLLDSYIHNHEAE